MGPLTTAFPELLPVRAGATRAGSALDEIYCNLTRSIVQKEILKPLEKLDGTPSDHAVIAASAKLPRVSRKVTSRFTFRTLTKKGTEKFKCLLLNTNWDTIKNKMHQPQLQHLPSFYINT